MMRQVKSKLIICFDIKGIVLKEFILAGQIVNSAYNVTFYGDYINLTTKELAVFLFVCTQQHSSSSNQHRHTNPLNTSQWEDPLNRL
jgi:hypothetical protein